MLILGLTVVGCGKILSSDAYEFSLNDASGTKLVEMQAIKRRDKKMKPFRDDLKGAEYLYYAEISLVANQEIVVQKTEKSTGILVYTAQTFHSGKVENLSSNLLNVPDFSNADLGNGTSWNRPFTVKNSGNYYVVFAEINGNVKAVGLITK